MKEIGGNCIMNLIVFTPSKDAEMDAFGMKYIQLWCRNLLKDDPSGYRRILTGIIEVSYWKVSPSITLLSRGRNDRLWETTISLPVVYDTSN
jgi:hypothetical protein